jgi:hypothetical protein
VLEIYDCVICTEARFDILAHARTQLADLNTLLQVRVVIGICIHKLLRRPFLHTFTLMREFIVRVEKISTLLNQASFLQTFLCSSKFSSA